MRECGERLYEQGHQRPVAICTEPWGTEHSHSDRTPVQALYEGKARLTAEGARLVNKGFKDALENENSKNPKPDPFLQKLLGE